MYYFYLGLDMLPVPPPSMVLKYGNKNKTYDLINGEEINVIKPQGLKTIEFNAMLPNKWYPFADYGGIGNIVGNLIGGSNNIVHAKTYLSMFANYRKTKQPFRFIVTRFDQRWKLLHTTNMLMTLEDYSADEDAAASGLDIQVPLVLKQYVQYGTKEGTIETDENGNKVLSNPRTREETKAPSSIIKATTATTALELCRIASGGGADWRAVAESNLLDDANNIAKGKVLDLLK